MSLARFSLSEFDDSELPPWSPEFYGTEGFSPPSQPSTSRLRGAGKRRWLSKLGTVGATPEDRSYLSTTTGSFSTHTRKPRKTHWAHAGTSNANRYANDRRYSFSSRAFANGAATAAEAANASYQLQKTLRTHYAERGRNIQAAFPRREARRCSTYELTNEDSEVTAEQLSTPVTTTDVKYHSHGRAARQLRQLATRPPRRPQQCPPRNIIVFSKPRSSSLAPPPRIDDFSDIPPAEVILFDSPATRLLSSRLDRLHQLSPGRVTSPGETNTVSNIPARLESPPSGSRTPPTPQASELQSVPEETDERRTSPEGVVIGGRAAFEQIWVLCVVASVTLLMPFVIVILSYLLAPAIGASEAPVEPSVTRGTTSSSSPFTLPTWPTNAAANAWAGVPAACRRQRATSDDITGVKRRTSVHGAAVPNHDLFCLYNSSRFFRNSSGSFLPDNLPLAVCRYIIYWSFRLVDGRLLSRTPAFDNLYGLAKLKDILRNANFSDIKVLLAVGGYVEDSPQFSLLGRDLNARDRFAKGATRQLEAHNIDGLALHWVEAEPGCQHRSSVADNTTLRAVFVSLRRIFDLNGFRATLGVIVPGQVDKVIVNSVVDVVDYVFLETRKASLGSPPGYKMCGSVAAKMRKQFLRLPSYSGNKRKFCMTMSVAPWKLEVLPSIGSGQLPNLTALSSSGDPPGFASVLEMCSSSPCLLNLPAQRDCVAVRVSTLPSSTHVLLLMHEVLLRNVFSSGPSYERCALLVDLELDNYAGQCNFSTRAPSNVFLPDYWLVDRLILALERSSLAINSSLPYC
ncbi:hypothetical protein HPB52_023050 [Rhipicephalus sanguineus]|uniref:GH18 domain-containing protein n=1 Tax=Rhipicephalus sanguineus TaxID=34632 RepID=A0A9D4PI48_RHISA|nr:hypothetical protein HPB52_023050 [Rhipicephalus sanguineus]